MFSFVSMVLALLLAADLLWWWRVDRRARFLRPSLPFRLLIALFMSGQIILVVWVLGVRVTNGLSSAPPPELLMAAAYLWHLLVLPASWIIVTTGGIVSVAWGWARRLAGQTASASTQAAPRPAATSAAPIGAGETTTRRQFLGMATTLTPVLLTGAGVAYSRIQLGEFRIRPMTLTLATLPPSLDGLRIAVVSDLHVGTFTHGPTVNRIVEETSRLKADLVLLPGDLINNRLSDLSDALDAVCNMQSRHGAFLSIGNHDLIENGTDFVRRVRARARNLKAGRSLRE